MPRHLTVKRQVSDDLLQPGVLVLKRLNPSHLVWQQATILLLAIEVGGFTDPGLAADLRHRRALLALPQNEGLLHLGELRYFHAIPLLSQPGKSSGELQLQTIQFLRGQGSTSGRQVVGNAR
jgi:hypothetical protein